MCNVIGTRKGELALILGSLFSPEEALKIGLVDEVAPDLPSANEIAQAQLKKFLKIPGNW
jgi:Delta3-Delta2-enoyl-CoA isomerase